MSHILDALRKAQDETTGKPRSSVAGGDALIARRGTARYGGMTTRVWGMIGSGVVLLAVVGWLLYGPSRKTVPQPVAERTAPSGPTAPDSVPAPAATVPPPVASVPPSAASPAASAPAPQSAPAAKAASPATPTPGDDEEERETRRRSGRRGREAAAPVPAAVTAAPAAAVRPEPVPAATPAAAPVVTSAPDGIKLTGIAWQESKKLRRAVINDILVGEGVQVGGATVVEIRPTAVRFEKNGSVFEVPLLR